MGLTHVLCVLIPLCMAIVTVHGRMSLKPCSTNSKIRCMVSPCDVQKCAAFPNAECRNNLCGSCGAEFWVGSNEVTSQCDKPLTSGLAQSKQVNDCPPVRCFVSPCDSATCPAKPSAKCQQHKCECTATFWEGSNEVTNQCQQVSTLTRALTAGSSGVRSTKDCSGKPKVQCGVNPCQVGSCPAFPQAQCRYNYCGGCFAEFWVGSEEVTSRCQGDVALNTAGGSPDIVSRNLPTKPEMNKPDPSACLSSCFFPPCRLGYCAAFPQAKCVNNFCDGCRAQYFVGNQEVTSMCRDRVPGISRLFSNRRRRFRSFFSPWMALLDMF